MSLSVRALAAAALADMLHDKSPMSLQQTLPPIMQACLPRDRALLMELVHGTARQGLYLQAILKPMLQKPATDMRLQALLMLGLYQLMFTRIPAHAALQETVGAARDLDMPGLTGLINAVLRRFQRESDILVAAAQSEIHAHPRWLVDTLRRDWPLQAESIMMANNQIPDLTLRVNLRHVSRDTYLDMMLTQGLAARALDTPQGIALDEGLDLAKLPHFAEGWVSIQDAHAQRAAYELRLQPGQRVLDACAAPGGKAAHILELADVYLLALDNDAQRLQRVEENLSRLQLTAELRQADARYPDDWWDGQPFDRILLDAPCSGTGVIRRHPDIKWLRRPRDITANARVQRELLDKLWPLLATDGLMLYATCSLLREENDRCISGFLREHPDARCLPLQQNDPSLLGLQLFPGPHDGFYYALLQRVCV